MPDPFPRLATAPQRQRPALDLRHQRVLAELRERFELCDWMIAALTQEPVEAVRPLLRDLVDAGLVYRRGWSCAFPGAPQDTRHRSWFFAAVDNTDAERNARLEWESLDGDPLFDAAAVLRLEWRGQIGRPPPPADPEQFFTVTGGPPRAA